MSMPRGASVVVPRNLSFQIVSSHAPINTICLSIVNFQKRQDVLVKMLQRNPRLNESKLQNPGGYPNQLPVYGPSVFIQELFAGLF